MIDCQSAAEYAAKLRAVEARLQKEVTEPVGREYTPDSWRGRILALSGITKYVSIAGEILGDAKLVIEEMETCVPPSPGNGNDDNGGNGGNGGDPPPPEPGNDLEGVRIASNSAQDIKDWAVTSTILRVRIRPGDICIDHTKRGKCLGNRAAYCCASIPLLAAVQNAGKR